MVGPIVVLVALLVLLPIGYTLIGSFFQLDPLRGAVRFVGLANYLAIGQTPGLVTAAVNTIWYLLFGVVLSMALSLGFALALHGRIRLRGVLLGCAMLPWALPGVVTTVVWSWIYDPSVGVLNSVLHSVGLISHYHLWIGTHPLESIFLISLTQVWKTTPLGTLLILAALEGIPTELYEAAYVDGADYRQVAQRIMLPLARPGIAIALVEAVVSSLTIFDQVYVLNHAATTAASLVSSVYYVTFQNLNFGVGYALALCLGVVIIVTSVVLVKLTYRRVEF